MQAFQDQGIKYDAEYFTSEDVAAFFDDKKLAAVMAGDKAKPAFASVFAGVSDPSTAFAKSWADALQDPQFRAEARKQGYTQELALADFQRKQTAPLSPKLDSDTVRLMQTSVTVQATDDAYVHQVDGVQVFYIPKSVSGAALASKRVDIILQSVIVVIDALFLVAAAMGVSVAAKKERIAGGMKTIGGRLRAWFSGAAKELKHLEQQGKKLDIVMTVLKGASGVKGFSVKDTIKAILRGQRWWEKAVNAVQLVAAVGLLVATAGGSVLKQIAQLGLAIAVFVTDVVKLIEAILSPDAGAGAT